jgi:ABC-type transport system involved in multi-copper enzyme maturation permease subunit
VGGSLIVAGVWVASKFLKNFPPEASDRLAVLVGRMYTDPAPLFAMLIPVAIGLRAAVAVSSERERSTWDALLTSPLSGREILSGKLLGSLYRLRWLFLAVLVSWILPLVGGDMKPREVAFFVGQAVVLSLFAAAVGVRASLACATATRAMSATIGVFFVTLIVMSIVMAIASGSILLVMFLVWMAVAPLGLVTPGARPWVPVQYFGVFWMILMVAGYLSLTLTLITESWTRFDTLSGRSEGSEREEPVQMYLEGKDSPIMPSADSLGQNLPVSSVS